MHMHKKYMKQNSSGIANQQIIFNSLKKRFRLEFCFVEWNDVGIIITLIHSINAFSKHSIWSLSWILLSNQS